MWHSNNNNSSHDASKNNQSYMMVPATAVIESNEVGHQNNSYPGREDVKYYGDSSSSPSAAAHVLEVVDGTALPRPASMGVAGDSNNNDSEDSDSLYVKGVVLEPSYNDVGFAVAFAVNVVATAAVAFFMGIPAVNSYAASMNVTNATTSSEGKTNQQNPSSGDDSVEVDYTLRWFLVLLLLGSMWSFLALRVLLRGALTRPTEFVRVAYFAAPILVIASSIVLFAVGDVLSVVWASVGLLWAILLLVGWRPLRKYIPFAAATLRTSAIAVQENSWAVAVSLGSVLVLMAWFVLWLLAFVGYIDHLDKISGDDDDPNSSFLTFMAYLFVFCLYWGQQVVRNVVHFTTSGAVSTWWFMPSHEHDGSRAVKDSLQRATTYSLGSICMASLLNTVAETAEAAMRNNDHQSLLTCIIVCLLSCVRAWLEYFNSFALVYAALYNSNYWTAGKQVVHLFKHAGWKTFINDALVFRVLFMCQFAAASLTGLSSMALFAAFGGASSSTSGSGDGGATYGTLLALMYVAGFVMGILASSPVLFVLESAARTIMVCLAEQPYQFQNAHPDLFELLTAGWAEAYPDAWQQQKVISVVTAAAPEPMRAPLV